MDFLQIILKTAFGEYFFPFLRSETLNRYDLSRNKSHRWPRSNEKTINFDRKRVRNLNFVRRNIFSVSPFLPVTKINGVNKVIGTFFLVPRQPILSGFPPFFLLPNFFPEKKWHPNFFSDALFPERHDRCTLLSTGKH